MQSDEASEPIVTVHFRRNDGQMAFVCLNYIPGQKLKMYLHDPVFKGHSPVSAVFTGRLGVYDQQTHRRVKLNGILKEGDIVSLGRGA